MEGNCTKVINDQGESKKYHSMKEAVDTLNSSIEGFELGYKCLIRNYLDKNVTYKGFSFISVVKKFKLLIFLLKLLFIYD